MFSLRFRVSKHILSVLGESKVSNGDGGDSVSSGDNELHMAEDDDQEMSGDESLNNNNNALNCDEEDQSNADIKEKLLKMNLGGRLLPLGSGNDDPREQLATLSQTITKLTGNLSKLSSPSNIQELSLLQATLLSLQQQSSPSF